MMLRQRGPYSKEGVPYVLKLRRVSSRRLLDWCPHSKVDVREPTVSPLAESRPHSKAHGFVTITPSKVHRPVTSSSVTM